MATPCNDSACCQPEKREEEDIITLDTDSMKKAPSPTPPPPPKRRPTVGARVQVHSLKSNPQYNGRVGTVIGVGERIGVKLDGDNKLLNIKGDNLAPSSVPAPEEADEEDYDEAPPKKADMGSLLGALLMLLLILLKLFAKVTRWGEPSLLAEASGNLLGATKDGEAILDMSQSTWWPTSVFKEVAEAGYSAWSTNM